MNTMKCFAIAVLLFTSQIILAAGFLSPGSVTYYIDSKSGSDNNAGTSPENAWKNLARINITVFQPGDKILLAAGSLWNNEQLYPKGSGNAQKPIIIDMYGKGTKPIINCNGAHLEAVRLYNQEYWEIRNLEITNTAPLRVKGLKGIYVYAENFGTAHHIKLLDLFIHDVNGSNVKNEGGGFGILLECNGPYTKSNFDNVLIEGCRLLRCDRNGISISNWPDYWKRSSWFPSLNVVIRNNVLEDIGGDGIVPIGCDGCLVEYNIINGARRRAQDAACGIWPWSCDNTVIQYNEVTGMKGTHDGQSFDSDWNCRNSLFQYNYSHDNQGGFLLVCNKSDEVMPSSCGNIGTIFRYNISRNDGDNNDCPIFELSGYTKNTLIYNNTIYTNKIKNGQFINTWNWGNAWPDDTRFYNNIFYIEGNSQYELGGATNTIFSNNVFYGNSRPHPKDPNGITANPMLVKPGSGARGKETLDGYKLQPGSPCIDAGKIIENNGGKDFWGNPVSTTKVPDIGAHQLSK